MSAQSDRDREQPEPREAWFGDPPAVLAGAVVGGFIFGFLLQKGGVAKFDILIGVLLLEEFTVLKVMLSAVVVGIVGMTVLRFFELAEPLVKETVIGSNVVGGVLFGVGFGLLAYCPGTDAAAAGQGNLDALTGIVGLIVGSYVYALCSRQVEGTIGRVGRLGAVQLTDVVPMPSWMLTLIVVLVLLAVLAGLAWL